MILELVVDPFFLFLPIVPGWSKNSSIYHQVFQFVSCGVLNRGRIMSLAFFVVNVVNSAAGHHVESHTRSHEIRNHSFINAM